MQASNFCVPPKTVFPWKAPKFGTRNLRLPVCAQATKQKETMYDLLSVSENAGQDEIKSAFRKLARMWHPDTCRSKDKYLFTHRFIQAREAYQVLSDPLLREDYDYRLKNECNGVLPKGTGVGESGFADWESQLESLKRRSYRRSATASWGSRMRAARSV